MSTSAPELYPKGPETLPEELLQPSSRYTMMVLAVLVSLLAFFILYLGLVGGSIYLIYWAVTEDIGLLASAAIVLVAGAFCLFLLKNLFKRQPPLMGSPLEITAEEEPRFFAFLEALCEETALHSLPRSTSAPRSTPRCSLHRRG